MNRNEFENALMSTIVEYISDQIVLKYMDACRQAAVLFSGAFIGYADAVESLKELKKEGWKLTVVLSRAASEVLTEERIKNDIEPESIYVEGAPINGRQIVDDNQFVVIPELTVNTVAKVANCISDNLLTNMIFRAMATGKPVIAAIDGCCPDNEVRAKMGFKVTEAYKAKMRSNLEDVQSYGIHLTTAANLSRKVNKVYRAGFDFPAPDSDSKSASAKSEQAAKTSCGCRTSGTDASVKLDKKVIGRVDIAKNARYQTIIVRRDALVTGLANDEASNRGIAIVRE
ncbi:MAG: flavoprotein [Eubacteriales bacterium]|nr:flavoprotein [Eubacteriales bacterium]